MLDEDLRPFDSIESALDFIILLESVIGEVIRELDMRRAASGSERYSNGLNLALYKLDQLSFHVKKSRRILNDLRLIRTVLVGYGSEVKGEEAVHEDDLPPRAIGASA
jgi:hypothetical protein